MSSRASALAFAACSAACGAEGPASGSGAGVERPPEVARQASAEAQVAPPQVAPDGQPAPPFVLPASALTDPLAEARELSKPENDDWDVETWDHAVHVWWDRMLAGADPSELVEADLAMTPLRPEATWRTVGAFRVASARPDARPDVRNGGAEPASPAQFAQALAELVGPAGWSGMARAKVKVVGVEIFPGGAETRLRVELQWREVGRRHVRAHWQARWSGPEPPRLAHLVLVDFEETDGPAAGPLFRDVTAAVLGGNPSYAQQIQVPLTRWAATLDASLGVSVIGHEGLALGDADGDGLDDLYVCQSGGLSNLLYLRQPDGTARDVSHEAGVDWLDASRSALFADLDGDGDQDLVVEADPELLILENAGPARFTLAASVRAPATTSLSAADADNDGDLDLYACAYMLPDAIERIPVPYHDANNGQRNTYLQNETRDGAWSFVDATEAVGLDQNNRRFSFAAAWEDYDSDGDQDLYVANDFGRKNLYRNDAPPGEPPRFSDVAAEAGVEDLGAGMGVTWADVDGNGHDDIYASNMFSSAGSRIAYQPRFQAGEAEADRAGYRRHARGNSLFLNRGDGTFREVSEECGAGIGRWAWGALFTDFENDGWPDIFVPNGFVTGTDPQDL